MSRLTEDQPGAGGVVRRYQVFGQRVGRFSDGVHAEYDVGPLVPVKRCWTYHGGFRVAQRLSEAWAERGQVWHFTVR